MPWTNSGGSRTSTPQHKRWRAAVLKRDNYRCQAHYPGCTGEATQADHIIPDAEGGELDLDNGQAICINCHKLKTQLEAMRGRIRHSRARPTRQHPGLTTGG